MIPERLISEVAKAKREQRRRDAQDGHNFYKSIGALNPRKPKVNTLRKYRRRVT
jgi:hypothetical protein